MMPAQSVGPLYPGLRRARFNQAVIALVGVFCAMDMTIVGLLIEPMKHDLGLDDFQVGLVHSTSFYAAYGLLAVPMGMLADSGSRVWMLRAAMLLWGGGLVLIGLSTQTWLIAVAKAAMGVALALTYPAAMSLMADSFAPARRAFASVTFGMGQDVGAGLGLLLGGLGYSALIAMAAADPDALAGITPWRAVSLLFAACGLLLFPSLLALREPARMERRSANKGTFRDLWSYRALLVPIFVGLMAFGGSVTGIRTWLAPALMRLYHLQPGSFALWMSLVMVGAGLAGHALSGYLVNVTRLRGGDRAAMTLAALSAMLCIPASFQAVAPAFAAFAVLSGVFLVASGISVAIPVVVINFRMPNELRGLCMGLYVVLISVAGMIGAPLIGFLTQQLGGDAMLGWSMALVGAPLALVSAASFWLAARSPALATSPAHHRINPLPNA